MLFTLDDVRNALAIVGERVPPTPQHHWPLLAELVGAEVWVKHENHTPAGAFKMRGGLVYVHRLMQRQPDVAGLISATRGNHGQSVAIAGIAAGLPVTIVVPHGNSPDKNAAMRGWGAELIEHGHDFQASREHAIELAAERGLHAVPSYHRDLALGVATYAYELFTAVPDLDAVYVPIGMGSGVCGLIGVRDALGLATEIIGVVSADAPAYARSFAAGEVVTTESAATFVDGVACRIPDADALAIIIGGAARIVQVSDDAAAEAMRVMMRTTHQMVEPAGAMATAGLLAERRRVAGRRVAVIQTGGNADASIVSAVLAGRTPAP